MLDQTSNGPKEANHVKPEEEEDEAWREPNLPYSLRKVIDTEQYYNITKSRNEALAPIEEAFSKIDTNGDG